MALDNIININKPKKKIGLSEERIRAVIPIFIKYISLWREYPDIFIDMMTPPKSNFALFFYQRIFLRAAIRHKYCYATFTRAFSKSFLSILILLIRCILYPGAKLFICSGGKEQAANIAKEKIEEIFDLFPAIKNETIEKENQFGKDYVRIQFKNGSRLDVVAVRESSRGGRRHGGLMEEVLLIDGEKLNTVIIPLMNVSRRAKNGEVDPEESLNKSQIYVTTAGFKDHYSYEKLIQLLIWQVVKPGSSFVFGGSWRIPVAHKLLDRNFVKDLKADGTFNEVSFNREYESIWCGSIEDAFFNSDLFDRHRVLRQPEYEHSGRSSAGAYYIISVDVGRLGCQSVACVIKVTPQAGGAALKTLVNIYTYDDEHFEDQAFQIKQLFYKYNARALVIDANGLGVGIVDYMIKPSTSNRTGEILPPFGVINDEERYYKKYETPDTQMEAMYLIKATQEINSEAHVNVLTQMSSGKVKLLIDERTAKTKLLSTKMGKEMSPEQRAEYLKPFTLTSILKEEMMNLREKREGKFISLETANRKIKKDKFSAFEYGLYYIKMIEDAGKKRKKVKLSDFMFFN